MQDMRRRDRVLEEVPSEDDEPVEQGQGASAQDDAGDLVQVPTLWIHSIQGCASVKSRWQLMYGDDERLTVCEPPARTFAHRIVPQMLINPITGVATIRGETKASAISSNQQHEVYAKGLGMSYLNPRFGIHVAELLRKFSYPPMSRSEFSVYPGYPDPMSEVQWVNEVCQILESLAILPVYRRGLPLPLHRFDPECIEEAWNFINNEQTPQFYYIGVEGYFEFAKVARAAEQLFNKPVHITNMHQLDYWTIAIGEYLKSEKEQL